MGDQANSLLVPGGVVSPDAVVCPFALFAPFARFAPFLGAGKSRSTPVPPPFVPTDIPGLTNWWDHRTGASAYGSNLVTWTDRVGSAVATPVVGGTWVNSGSGYDGMGGGLCGVTDQTTAYDHTIESLLTVTRPFTIVAVGADGQNAYVFQPFRAINVALNAQLSTNSGAGADAVSAYFGSYINSATPPALRRQLHLVALGAGATGNFKVWLDGADVTSAAVAVGNFGPLHFGGFTHTTQSLLLFNRLVDDAEIAQLWTDYFALTTYNLLCDGNSLTAGYLSTDLTTDSWPSVAGDALANGAVAARVLNSGVTGKTTPELDVLAPTNIDPYYSATATTNIDVIWEITNDVAGGATAVQARDHLLTYGTNRKLAHPAIKVLAATAIAATGRNNTAANTAVKALFTIPTSNPQLWLRTSGATPLEACLFLDEYPQFQDPTNLTYYNADELHLTDVGYALVAAKFQACLGLF